METNYELALVVKPLLPDDVHSKVVVEIEKVLKKLGGKMTLKEEWGKRHLAYDIKGHQEGYYLFYTMTLGGDKVQEFQASVKLVKDLLRFLVIREDQL